MYRLLEFVLVDGLAATERARVPVWSPST